VTLPVRPPIRLRRRAGLTATRARLCGASGADGPFVGWSRGADPSLLDVADRPCCRGGKDASNWIRAPLGLPRRTGEA